MFDKVKALENARKKLTRQNETLKHTLDELDHITKVAPTATALITAVRTRRDRQATAVKATEQLVALYEEKPKR